MYDYLLEELLLEDTLLEKMTAQEKDENFLSNMTVNEIKKSKNPNFKGTKFKGLKLGKNGWVIGAKVNDTNGIMYSKYNNDLNPDKVRRSRHIYNTTNAAGVGIGAAAAGVNIRNITKFKKQLKDLDNPKIAKNLYEKSNSSLTFDEWVTARKKQLKKSIGIGAVGTGLGVAGAAIGGKNLYKANKKFKPIEFKEDIEFLIETADIPYFDEF